MKEKKTQMKVSKQFFNDYIEGREGIRKCKNEFSHIKGAATCFAINALEKNKGIEELTGGKQGIWKGSCFFWGGG